MCAEAEADIGRGNDIRMIQPRHRPRFQLEPLSPFGIVLHFRRQNLQRRIATQSRIARSLDFPHPVSAERRDDLRRGIVRGSTSLQRELHY